jgi:hypothetical protein
MYIFLGKWQADTPLLNLYGCTNLLHNTCACRIDMCERVCAQAAKVQAHLQSNRGSDGKAWGATSDGLDCEVMECER